MPTIICSCIDCEHHSKRNDACLAYNVTLRERYVHTAQGYRHYWVCNEYKDNGMYNETQKIVRGVLYGE